LQFGNDLIRELSVHAAVEEQILYPTLKTVLNDEPDTTKSLSEHQDMKEILEKMRNTQPSDPEYRQLANRAYYSSERTFFTKQRLCLLNMGFLSL
jgi:hemerythrin superfamily protein